VAPLREPPVEGPLADAESARELLTAPFEPLHRVLEIALLEPLERGDLLEGEPEQQGECQLRASSDGSKMYAFYHSMIAEEEDPDEAYSRWYPWRPEVTYENDLWFRRVIFWPETPTTP